MTELKRLADQLASDVLEKSDDSILLIEARELKLFIKSMPIKRENAVEEASEYFEFEGMKFNKAGEELETAEEVEEKAVKFLESKGFTIED
jgi:hypothetical protein